MPSANSFPLRVRNAAMCQSQLWSISCFSQYRTKVLGALLEALHLMLQWPFRELQGAFHFPALHRRETGAFLTAPFVSCSASDAASRQGPSLLKLVRFYLCKKMSSVQLLLGRGGGIAKGTWGKQILLLLGLHSLYHLKLPWKSLRSLSDKNGGNPELPQASRWSQAEKTRFGTSSPVPAFAQPCHRAQAPYELSHSKRSLHEAADSEWAKQSF